MIHLLFILFYRLPREKEAEESTMVNFSFLFDRRICSNKSHVILLLSKIRLLLSKIIVLACADAYPLQYYSR